jgi:MFS family permease
LPDDRDYRLIFAASLLTTVSGSISGLALPLTAVLHLQAGPLQMALLMAFGLLPFALFSLPAGAWIDRSHKKRIGIAFNGLAAATMTLVPAAFMLDMLSLPILYLLEFVVGSCSVIGGSAVQVLLTHVVGRERLLAANAQMTASQSAVAVVGPAFAALLVARFGSEMTLSACALLYAAGALVLWRVRRDAPPADQPSAGWWPDALAGVKLIGESPLLRALAVFAALWLFLLGAYGAQFVLFTTRDLGLSASDLAVVSSLGAAGALMGSIGARRFGQRHGARPVMLAGLLMSAVGMGLYPLAGTFGAIAGLTLVAAAGIKLFTEFGTNLYTVNYISLRHRITPDAMLGRVTATMRGLGVSAAPVGALAGGMLAEAAGIAATLLLVAAAGILLWLAALRHLPAEPASV